LRNSTLQQSELHQQANVIILACSLVLLIALGTAEVQPWDEALYAVRARAILEWSAWSDQTPYALGGLYSSSYPPLSVWLMAVSMKIFGQTPFAIRFVSMLCGAGLLVGVYDIARWMFTKSTAIVAPVILAGCIVWNTYSRWGMTDIPLICFSVGALAFFLRAFYYNHQQKELPRQFWIYIVFYGVCTWSALMTKVGVSLLPLCFLALPLLSSIIQRFYPLTTNTNPVDELLHRVQNTVSIGDVVLQLDKNKESRNPALRWLTIVATFAVLLAVPWYWMMASTHGKEFTSVFFIPHVYSVVESNSRSLGVLYYINQLLIQHPLMIFSFTWFIAVSTRRTIITASRSLILDVLLALWFVGALILFSIAPTKMPHYTLIMLIPAILLSLKSYELWSIHLFKEKQYSFYILIVLFACFWVSSSDVRNSFRGILSGSVDWISLVILICLGLAFLALLRMKSERRISLVVRLYPFILYAIPIAFIIHMGILNLTHSGSELQGAKSVAEWLKERDETGTAEVNERDIVVLYHKHTSADSLVPDVSWYTEGWTAGLRDGYTVRHVALPESDVSASTLIELDTVTSPILYCGGYNPTLIARVRSILDSRRTILFSSPNYVIYGEYQFRERPISMNQYGKNPITDNPR
jgi:4-amino-4-deoxy-L-arabinose transferase-like glycosyltransferase